MFLKEFTKGQTTGADGSMAERKRLENSKWRRQSAAEKARYEGLAAAANLTAQDAGDSQFLDWMAGTGQTGVRRSLRETKRKREAVARTIGTMRDDGLWTAGTGVFCFDGPLVGCFCMGN